MAASKEEKGGVELGERGVAMADGGTGDLTIPNTGRDPSSK